MALIWLTFVTGDSFSQTVATGFTGTAFFILTSDYMLELSDLTSILVLGLTSSNSFELLLTLVQSYINF